MKTLFEMERIGDDAHEALRRFDMALGSAVRYGRIRQTGEPMTGIVLQLAELFKDREFSEAWEATR